MHQRTRSVRTLAAAVALLAGPTALPHAALGQTIPNDPKALSPSVDCTVPAAMFASWFAPNPPAVNGAVAPANSVTFPDTPNCSFYQWSQQMFLWLTSPAPKTYGGGGRVFDTPAFFDVSPPDANGDRVYIPHTPGLIRNLAVRTAQLGPNRHPIVFSKTGQPLEVAPAATGPNGRQIILDRSGALVEISAATLGANRVPVFLDAAGKAIQPHVALKAPNALTATQPSTVPLQVQKFTVNGRPVLIDSAGNIVEAEVGQAQGAGVLQPQNGPLVYYITIVNDVWAYFQTGVKNGAILPGTQFPTTAATRDQIVAYAAAHGKTITPQDANALAIELKTSWIEAASLPNPGNYITMEAVVPAFKPDPADPTHKLIPNGQKKVLLAMVGMHVVGSTKGHPEMIWATFVHFGNTPNAAYRYNSTSGPNPKTVAQNTSGSWLFAPTNAAGPFNVERMSLQEPNIVAKSGQTIGPSATLRMKAWGAAFGTSPNPIDGSDAMSNTEIILIDNSVRNQMPAGDVRNNYFMMGATWTIGGAAPNSTNQVGTSMLANSTMETYHQGSANTKASGGTNCFSCHATNQTAVSHVFPDMKPLF